MKIFKELAEDWKLGGEELKRRKRPRSPAGNTMKIAGVVTAAAGAYILLIMGHNYGTCQNTLVQAANQQTCQQASGYHEYGIIVIIAGAVITALAVILGDRPRP